MTAGLLIGLMALGALLLALGVRAERREQTRRWPGP